MKDGDIEIIINILKKYPRIEQALIFGSRAMGSFKPGSDVDIVLKGSVIDVITEVGFLLNGLL